MTTQTLPNVPGGHTAYGITVHELGEDGDLIVAFGHHNKRRFFAACNHFARTVWNIENLAGGTDITWDVISKDISQTHVLLDDEDPDEWSIVYVDADAPGAIPITKWWT
jgi:hypothetical protein